MLPEIDLDEIKEGIQYIETQIMQSAHGMVPMYDLKKQEFIADSRGRIVLLEGKEAIKMWIKKILYTYLNKYEIYYDSFGYREYGTDLKKNFFGKRLPEILILGELEREIREALSGHRLIKRVENFEITSYDTTLKVSFNVVLSEELGQIEIHEEVRIPHDEG